LLHDPSPFEHHDHVGHGDGREPVRHKDRDAAAPAGGLRLGREPFEDGVLGASVEGGGRFVEEDEERHRAHERA
jgi:hypothetical protein